MEEKLKSLFSKLQDVFHSEVGCENTATKEGAKKSPAAPGDPASSLEDQCAFKSLLSYVEQTILKPWSDNHAEFLVLSCFEDENLNPVNYMSVLSSFGFVKEHKTSLEMVKSYIKRHCDQYYPNAVLLMNNLGVMFSENALYEESEDCLNMAEMCLQHQQDQLKHAVITLNEALLKKVLGKDEEAEDLAATAASLCHDISLRTTNDAHLTVKVQRRVANMLQEFGNLKLWDKILRNVVCSDTPTDDEFATVVLSWQLMKIQLEGMGQKIPVKEVKDFISHLLTLLDKPDASKVPMNAEFMRIVISAAKICLRTGQCKQACELLNKLQSIFFLVHGENNFLYGSLLYQIGCFLHGCGKFGDAETALKQAEDILICYCGENHHSVALCRSVLGSCILLKGNAKDALEVLNEALTMFKKLNPIHPQVGEILLKLAFMYVEERNFQQAQETVQEAEAIFLSSCGKVSCKTASAFFQVGMIFQRSEQFRMSAVEKIQEGIEMMINLGMTLNHPDVMFWSSFLGVLKNSLGMVKEAEKCFIDIQNFFPICHDRGSKETEIITPDFLHPQDRAGDKSDRSSSVKAQVISLVNLMHMERGDKRIQYLDKLLCCLKEEEVEEIRVTDFAGQDLYLFSHRVPIFNRPAVLIILDSLPVGSEAVNGTDCKLFLASSAEKASLTLFARIQGGSLNMKEINRLTSSFRESVNMLFLQPKLRKGIVEGKDLYVELPAAVDISSFSSHLDCLPLLVELELTKSQEQCDEFDYLTSWQSSVDSATHSVPHVSYFSFWCVNQREAEFVFAHLSQNLAQKLALNGFQEDIISDVSLEENVARFIFQESRNFFLTVVVRNLSVIVKCCCVKESDANCFCCSVRNALNTAIESLTEIASVTPVKSSGWLACEDFASGLDPDVSDSCSLSVNRDPVGSGLTFETGNSTRPCTWLSRRSTEDLKRKKTVGKSQNKNVEIIHSIHHRCGMSRASIDVGLCLLECLLNRSKPVSFEEEELNGGELSSTDEQSTENSVFAETSVVKQVLYAKKKLERFGDRSSEHKARDRRKDEERDMEEAESWPQQGGTTCSQQLYGNYINQGALSSSSTQSNKIGEDIPLLQQGACLDAKVTGNRPLGTRDWEHEGAKPKQVRKQDRSEVVQLPSDPPAPQFDAFLVESSNDSSLSQGGRVERTSKEREQHGQFERKINWQEWLQTARKRDERNDKEMQDAGRRSQEENAAASEQSTESPVFSEASLAELVPREEETREQVVGRSSEQRARDGIKKEEREMKEAGSWPQQGGTTYSQQLLVNCDNQSSSSSSSTQADKITVEDMSFVQQGTFLDAKETGNRQLGARDWESEGAKPRQVSKQGLSEVLQILREPPVPQVGASSVDSSNDSSLSQDQHVERTSSEREQRGQFERKVNCQKWMIRGEQGAGKKRQKKERKMQESKRTSQEENADADSEQSTESSVFGGTSLVEPLLREDEKRDQFVARNSERRAKERTRKEERVVREDGSRPQQGGTTCSQQLSENYDNQGALSSSSTQSNKIVEDTPLLQQGAFLDEKVTGNRSLRARDWESEGAKPKQVSKKGRSEVEKKASEPPDPWFGACSVGSSNDSSLSQGQHVEKTSIERDQRGKFERKANCQEWLKRDQRAGKRGVTKESKMQEAQNRSQDENAACSQQLRGKYHDQCSLNTSRTQGGIAGNIPWSQQDALTDEGRSLLAADRERDGLTDEFLARHTQYMSLRGSLNQCIGTNVSLPPDISAKGTSFCDSQDRSQPDSVQSAGQRAQNPTLTLGNLNSAADNENATSDPPECILNQSVSVSSTDFALGTGTRRQREIHFSSSNAVMSAAEVLAQEDVPVDEPCHGGGNITRGAPIRDYVPDSLDITGSSLAWVPHQRDTYQQYSRRASTVNCEWCGSCLYEQREGTSHQCQAAECHLCLGLIDPSIRCHIFPCGHKFHIICANDWILRGHDTCPICGHPLFDQPAEE